MRLVLWIIFAGSIGFAAFFGVRHLIWARIGTLPLTPRQIVFVDTTAGVNLVAAGVCLTISALCLAALFILSRRSPRAGFEVKPVSDHNAG
jgi:hypothetical protein